MFDEPFRWMEAISTRHSYVQEKLKTGQPVLAVPFNEGALLLSFTRQPGKIFEVYDRIALGGLGHPADVERLRMSLLDMAHLEGFNRSDKDVNIARLLQFGVAPALKQNFEEIQRAPYLAMLLLVEIGFDNRPSFFRLNYDGHWETFQKGVAISGQIEESDWMEMKISETKFAAMPLDEALRQACAIWEEGKKHVTGNEEKSEEEDPVPLSKAFDKFSLEVGVLSTANGRKSLYRSLTEQETDSLKATYQDQ